VAVFHLRQPIQVEEGKACVCIAYGPLAELGSASVTMNWRENRRCRSRGRLPVQFEVRGMIKGGIAIPAGSSKYREAQPCPRNSLKLHVKLHS